jgi:hypothetical protein
MEFNHSLAGFLFLSFSIGWTVFIPGPKKRKPLFFLSSSKKKKKKSKQFIQDEPTNHKEACFLLFFRSQ